MIYRSVMIAALLLVSFPVMANDDLRGSLQGEPVPTDGQDNALLQVNLALWVDAVCGLKMDQQAILKYERDGLTVDQMMRRYPTRFASLAARVYEAATEANTDRLKLSLCREVIKQNATELSAWRAR